MCTTPLKFLLFGISIIVLGHASFAITADEAIDQAFAGQESGDFDIGSHGFRLKPIQKQVGAHGTALSGQISHLLNHRRDDQVYWTMLYRSGEDVKTTVRTDRGGFWRMVGVPGAIADKIGQAAEGSWEAAAQQLLDRISLRLQIE